MHGFEGDPGHEGGSQPMKHLQGGMSGVHTQMPMESENGGTNRGTADAPIDTHWNAFISSTGGDTPNRGTDSNGRRGAPSPA